MSGEAPKSLLAQKPCLPFEALKERSMDFLVCVCMGVMYSDISAAIERGDRSFKQLQDSLMVGTGCSSCHAEVREILDKSLKS
jgi:bacterioferritin-associated ferredoxin